jgi:hypothetical protein
MDFRAFRKNSIKNQRSNIFDAVCVKHHQTFASITYVKMNEIEDID